MDDNTVSVNIRRLRAKIEDDPRNPELIKRFMVWDISGKKVKDDLFIVALIIMFGIVVIHSWYRNRKCIILLTICWMRC